MENAVKSIVWSQDARDDIDEIYAFYVEESHVAEKVCSSIIDSVGSLIFCEQYQIDEYYPPYRRIVVGNHKVLYMAEKGVVTIVGVVDARRQIKKIH
ncbi:type II toxin-antitoxin system RelE/ParE family toxin [Chitinophagales bacterium]|nr:type II toxin-antitoxin system RelE/ParE family toxin [Chitinophagales bacterium]